MLTFADTHYFIALLNAADDYHAAAMRWSRESRRPMLTTSWVLVEVGDAMTAPPYRSYFVSLVRALQEDARVTILGPEPILFDAGFDLFSRRPDKVWSLTDCISFVAMERAGAREALTADKHFVQAGFRVLLDKNTR